GGTGAPLVLFVDALLFMQHAPCVALNLGGIANMTLLPEGIAFDSGPANLPIDTYVALRTNGTKRYDENGELARRGTVDEALLNRLLVDPYFSRSLPKTTGREEFGAPYIAHWRAELDALSLADAVATLTALTVRTVAEAKKGASQPSPLMIVSGGGARNPALLAGLREELPGVRIAISDEFGVNADAKEAIAFAVLGYTTLRGRAAGLPRVTGASGPRILGSIVPHDLDALLKTVHEEESRQGSIVPG
ncbi:MAG TPA: anhydro-N-acetylmuramic acid kinase, partial [Candidatus Limnocylindrales bacterium]|nr:anhydro-N-acetylmuramic acid kinase [Candidatus Limnocylindrales bacterium]